MDPSSFLVPVQGPRRVAKDENYLDSVQQIWVAEGTRKYTVETKEIQYSARGDSQNPLSGRLVRRRRDSSHDSAQMPGILLFHTAAGPQDIFLFYKADVLLQNLDCVVMICDILSDDTGWGWDPDRSHYNEVRLALMNDGAKLLKERVDAAVQSLGFALPQQVDMQRLAAMGWCLGGQPILEMGGLNMEPSNNAFFIQAMITFHGVFARDTTLRVSTNPTQVQDVSLANDKSSKVLICNGRDDPFVKSSDLEQATTHFESNGFAVEVLEIEQAKHGFTNPAQDFNENPAFGFSKEGASLAWVRTMELLTETLVK